MECNTQSSGIATGVQERLKQEKIWNEALQWEKNNAVERALDLEKKLSDLIKANESNELIIKNLWNHNYKLKN